MALLRDLILAQRKRRSVRDLTTSPSFDAFSA
jgi:hypothetical protein